MNVFGLVGFPLSHSFSKRYFTDKFRREGISDYIYELFPLDNISAFPALWQKNPELRGVNVTIPYKEKVITYLTDSSDVVLKTGACNCIKKTGDKLTGYNTDVVGFENVLLKNLHRRHKDALILGTGGAAKAVQYVLEKNGISYLSVSRNPGIGKIGYESVNEEVIGKHLLIINTTPQGMFPLADAAPEIPYGSITPDHFLFDLIYNPAKTVFLKKGEEQGAFIQNGEEMLVIQAEESWKIWTTGSEK